MKRETILAALALCLLATGCKQTVITGPNGWSFKRTTFAYADKIGELQGPIGTTVLVLKQYGSDADRALAIAQQAVGLAQAAAK